jgi:hypothetical protein
MIKYAYILPLVLLLTSCGESYIDAYSRGYGDGYASGYNTTCNIRSTLIAGDFDKKGYKDGYDDGRRVGSSDCLTDRANGRVR